MITDNPLWYVIAMLIAGVMAFVTAERVIHVWQPKHGQWDIRVGLALIWAILMYADAIDFRRISVVEQQHLWGMMLGTLVVQQVLYRAWKGMTRG
jgi:hypothetical protein